MRRGTNRMLVNRSETFIGTQPRRRLHLPFPIPLSPGVFYFQTPSDSVSTEIVCMLGRRMSQAPM